MVYLAKKGDRAVHHTGLEAMKAIDGIDTPEMTVTEAEFDDAGGLARIINGALVLGKTEAEAAREQAEARAREIDAELRRIDAKSARPARAVAKAVAGGAQPDPTDLAKLEEYETKADAPRRAALNAAARLSASVMLSKLSWPETRSFRPRSRPAFRRLYHASPPAKIPGRARRCEASAWRPNREKRLRFPAHKPPSLTRAYKSLYHNDMRRSDRFIRAPEQVIRV